MTILSPMRTTSSASVARSFSPAGPSYSSGRAKVFDHIPPFLLFREYYNYNEKERTRVRIDFDLQVHCTGRLFQFTLTEWVR